MRILTISAVCMIALASCKKSGGDGGSVITPPAPPPEPKEYTFEASPVWAEEFDYTGAPDPNSWTYDTGDHGWGNNELQNYTTDAKNVQVKDGMLTITAIKESSGSKAYSSTRLVSRGKKDFTYGRLEVKAKLPSGRGTWPAIWMLPTARAYGDWPKSGEIDVMEHVGYDPNVVHFSIHSEAYNHKINTQKTATRQIPTAMTDFHLYRVDWTPAYIRGFFDGIQVFSFANDGKGYATWPFDKTFHLLINVAVGGDWGGVQGVDDTAFPATMVVDYVRLYKLIP